jgi:hypothetical protein
MPTPYPTGRPWHLGRKARLRLLGPDRECVNLMPEELVERAPLSREASDGPDD